MNPMEPDELIPVELFCSATHVEAALLDALEESGLVRISVVEERRYIAPDQLDRAERLVRLHDDLGINVEGIEAIEHLLERMQEMHEEMRLLRNRLRRFGEQA